MAAPTKDDLIAAIRRLPFEERLRLIRQAAHELDEDSPTRSPLGASLMASAPGWKLTVDELLAARLTPAPGIGSVALCDMESAIAEGASDRGRS